MLMKNKHITLIGGSNIETKKMAKDPTIRVNPIRMIKHLKSNYFVYTIGYQLIDVNLVFMENFSKEI